MTVNGRTFKFISTEDYSEDTRISLYIFHDYAR